ncbi:MAG: PrgI family protein [Candidatus Dormiibacterota bacterium]
MATRIPQDVDLEDRLVFGLTPVRFGYLVIGGLAAFTVWSAQWGPAPIRLAVALPLAAAGLALAWGRLAGRAVDGWVADALRFLARNVRVERSLRHRAGTRRPRPHLAFALRPALPLLQRVAVPHLRRPARPIVGHPRRHAGADGKAR